jgi:hypothetical protein
MMIKRQQLFVTAQRIFPDAAGVEAEIREVQGRLGTTQERRDDFERAQKAAHRLNNMLCAALLVEKD